MTSSIDDILAGYESLRAGQEALYKDLHQHPELSHHEHRTARRVAEQLQDAGFTIASGSRRHRGSRRAGQRRRAHVLLRPIRRRWTDVIREAETRSLRVAVTLDARLEDAHMGGSMQTKAWASDADQGIGQ